MAAACVSGFSYTLSHVEFKVFFPSVETCRSRHSSCYTEDKVAAAIAEVDADRNGSIEWNEFQAFMTSLRGGKVSHRSKFRQVHTKVGSARDSIMKAIKDAEPKKVQKKRTWAVNVNNSSTEGRYDGKTKIAGGPPPKRNVADLP